MVTAGPLVNVDTTSWAGARTRDLLDSLEGLLLILTAALGIGLIVVARLFLVEWHLADEAVAGFAHLAGEDVAVAFGEVSS
jgi:hypothetical protein